MSTYKITNKNKTYTVEGDYYLIEGGCLTVYKYISEANAEGQRQVASTGSWLSRAWEFVVLV